MLTSEKRTVGSVYDDVYCKLGDISLDDADLVEESSVDGAGEERGEREAGRRAEMGQGEGMFTQVSSRKVDGFKTFEG